MLRQNLGATALVETRQLPLGDFLWLARNVCRETTAGSSGDVNCYYIFKRSCSLRGVANCVMLLGELI